MIGQIAFLLQVPDFDYKPPVEYQINHAAPVQDAEFSDGHGPGRPHDDEQNPVLPPYQSPPGIYGAPPGQQIAGRQP
jgi:hypothetical protein